MSPWADLFLLEPRLRQYQWGGDAASLVGRLSARPGVERYAELWFGAHPADPSVGHYDGSVESLHDIIAGNPEGILGARVAAKFSEELPFLFKVLSIGSGGPLSLQAHPDERGAMLLHRRDPRHYPDPHHKPEMAIAITPVTLLCGFRPISELRQMIEVLPSLRQLAGDDIVARLNGAEEVSQQVRAVRELYRTVVMATREARGKATEQIGEVIIQRSHLTSGEEVFLDVLRKYGPSDVGVVTSLLLNCLRLEPGEAIFIGPNLIHAYVSGELVECMACSDNVVRAGLTQKYQDTLTLVEMLDYHPFVARILQALPVAKHPRLRTYESPAAEFLVHALDGERQEVSLEEKSGVVVCILLDGSASVVSRKRFLQLAPGRAVLIPPGAQPVTVKLDYGKCFLVSVP